MRVFPSQARIIGMVTSFELIYYNSSFGALVKIYSHLKLKLLFIKCTFFNNMNSITHLLFATVFFEEQILIERRIKYK